MVRPIPYLTVYKLTHGTTHGASHIGSIPSYGLTYVPRDDPTDEPSAGILLTDGLIGLLMKCNPSHNTSHGITHGASHAYHAVSWTISWDFSWAACHPLKCLLPVFPIHLLMGYPHGIDYRSLEDKLGVPHEFHHGWRFLRETYLIT